MGRTVLIVGASIAGLSAAIAAAEGGFSVICVDKKKEIATGISCAEGIAKELLTKVPFTIPDKFLAWEIDGISFFCDEVSVERKGRFWKGYTINRKGLEEWLFKSSLKKGVKFLFEHEFFGLRFNEGGANVTFLVNGKKVIIPATYIIAADGAQSAVAKFLKLGKREIYGRVISWEYKNILLEKSNLEQIYYGGLAPAGYAYVFPKSLNSANIGLGSTINEVDIRARFDQFIQDKLKLTTVGGEKVIEKSGVAIINRDIPLEFKNVLFAGDSASVNLKPFVEGILPSIISGYTAGQSLLDYKFGKYKEDFRSSLFNEYEESNRFFQIFLDTYNMNSKKSHLLNMGVSSQLFTFSEYDKMKALSYSELKKELLLRSQNE